MSELAPRGVNGNPSGEAGRALSFRPMHSGFRSRPNPGFVDITPGTRFGLVVVERRAQNSGTGATWMCLCDCGSRRVILGSILRARPPKTHRACLKSATD